MKGTTISIPKTAKYVLLAVLVLALAVTTYGWLDTAVSLDHARQQQTTEASKADVLSTLLLGLCYCKKRPEITTASPPATPTILSRVS
jgi:hypothetical protein